MIDRSQIMIYYSYSHYIKQLIKIGNINNGYLSTVRWYKRKRNC